MTPSELEDFRVECAAREAWRMRNEIAPDSPGVPSRSTWRTWWDWKFGKRLGTTLLSFCSARGIA